jgi:hypothetical protein
MGKPRDWSANLLKKKDWWERTRIQHGVNFLESNFRTIYSFEGDSIFSDRSLTYEIYLPGSPHAYFEPNAYSRLWQHYLAGNMAKEKELQERVTETLKEWRFRNDINKPKKPFITSTSKFFKLPKEEREEIERRIKNHKDVAEKIYKVFGGSRWNH